MGLYCEGGKSKRINRPQEKGGVILRERSKELTGIQRGECYLHMKRDVHVFQKLLGVDLGLALAPW